MSISPSFLFEKICRNFSILRWFLLFFFSLKSYTSHPVIPHNIQKKNHLDNIPKQTIFSLCALVAAVTFTLCDRRKGPGGSRRTTSEGRKESRVEPLHHRGRGELTYFGGWKQSYVSVCIRCLFWEDQAVLILRIAYSKMARTTRLPPTTHFFQVPAIRELGSFKCQQHFSSLCT